MKNWLPFVSGPAFAMDKSCQCFSALELVGLTWTIAGCGRV
jgi:hypothetical protein